MKTSFFIFSSLVAVGAGWIPLPFDTDQGGKSKPICTAGYQQERV